MHSYDCSSVRTISQKENAFIRDWINTVVFGGMAAMPELIICVQFQCNGTEHRFYVAKKRQNLFREQG